MGWAKYFFVPDLQYWRYEDLPRYGAIREQLDRRCLENGLDAAKRAAFRDILHDFEREAEDWHEKWKGWQRTETDDGDA